MKLGRLVIAAVVLLAAGMWLLIFYGHGATAFNMPVDQSSLHIDITTNGIAALVGVPLVVLGAAALAIAVLTSIVLQFMSPSHRERDYDDEEEHTSSSRGFLSLNE
jgi:hypothetical protein